MLSAMEQTRNHHLRRIFVVLLGAAVLVLSASPAHAGTSLSSDEARLASLTNQARAQAGLRSLTVASDLTTVARRHSADMAAKHSLYHNANLANEVSGWIQLGENVGDAGDIDSVQRAFMASPGHRSNILDSAWRD